MKANAWQLFLETQWVYCQKLFSHNWLIVAPLMLVLLILAIYWRPSILLGWAVSKMPSHACSAPPGWVREPRPHSNVAIMHRNVVWPVICCRAQLSQMWTKWISRNQSGSCFTIIKELIKCFFSFYTAPHNILGYSTPGFSCTGCIHTL